MARALVVFESMFGNTRAVAEAVGAALAEGRQVDVVEVAAAPDVLPEGVDLLVVGAPTHAFSLSRVSTRKSAADQATGGLVSRGRGVREWLDALAPVDRTVSAIAFDTKVKVGWLPGSAAKAITKRLRRLRFTLAGAPVSFYVGGTPGPLLEGEIERATAWARTIRATSRT
ncbi:flavodoxin [Actinosynnema sp. NPDC002837]